MQYRELLESKGVLLQLDDIQVNDGIIYMYLTPHAYTNSLFSFLNHPILQFSPRGDAARHAASALYDECFPEEGEEDEEPAIPSGTDGGVSLGGSTTAAQQPVPHAHQPFLRPLGRGAAVNVPAWMMSSNGGML